MAKRKQYWMSLAGVNSVDLQFSLGDTQYAAALLTAMGLSATAPTASNTKLIIPVTEERAAEMFGCIPVGITYEAPAGATGASARPRSQILTIAPNKNLNELVGQTYDGRRILTARPFLPEVWK